MSKLAESFNHYFVESVNETVSSMFESRRSIKFILLPNSINLEETDDTEIANALLSLKNVVPGIDRIKPQVLKFLHKGDTSSEFINRMFQNGIYPDIFKTAIVIPLSKSGKRNDIKDYRPVSILTTFNKAIEKILYKRIMNFIRLNIGKERRSL